jgi:hypothetical protein
MVKTFNSLKVNIEIQRNKREFKQLADGYYLLTYYRRWKTQQQNNSSILHHV